TLVYQGRLRLRGWRRLNARLLRECRQLRADDAAGRRWSARHYPGGYTSYNSAHRMHRQSPTFASLAGELDRHVAAFARRLQLDLTARALTMTDCCVNVMGRGAVHGLHLHPLSTISGTYYVAVPAGCPRLQFEDPRLRRFMASAPFLEHERPGVFYDVQLAASAPSTLCLEFASDVAAHTGLELRWHGPLQRPDQCAALVNDRTDVPRLEIWITMDGDRRLLFL